MKQHDCHCERSPEGTSEAIPGLLRRLWLLAMTLSISTTAIARIYIPVDQPSDKKMPVAITPLVPLSTERTKKWEEELPHIIQNDLEMSGYFEFIPPLAFLEPKEHKGLATDTINFDHWTAIEVQALIKGGISKKGNSITVRLMLFDPFLKQRLAGVEYTGVEQDARSIAHRFADEVLQALTGVQGPFYSHIAYSAVTSKSNKAIYIMDVDGASNYRITHDKSINLGPAWSPDASQIAYTSYVNGYPDIYSINLKTKEFRQLTNNHSMNIAPTFLPDGKQIAFTSSITDDPEIWMMDLHGKMVRQVTNTLGVDISPSFGPDGNQFIFSSERAGKLHIFKSSLDGSISQRLTFVGHFNDTPSWSPDGTRIVFCSQDEGNFDIFIMNSDGSMIQRLTAGEGNNEHPSWSPDSRFITFSSTRTGGPAIYIMRWDGANPTRVSKGNGILPEWGPYLR